MKKLIPISPDPSSYIFVRIPRTASTSICHVLNQQWDHKTASEWKNTEGFADKWKFSIVRHPYERFLSAFCFFGFFGEDDPNEFLKNNDIGTFAASINHGVSILRPQTEYLYENGILLVDLVGKYEELDKVWPQIAERLQITDHLPKMRRGFYVKEPLTQESKDKLYEFYKSDFEAFNYKR